MYLMSRPVPASLNGGGGPGGSIMDGSGTINPAALNAAVLPNPASAMAAQNNPRGVKRSRSPEGYGAVATAEGAEEDESKPRKRGRPPKAKVPESPLSANPQSSSSMPAPVQTPQMPNQSLPQPSPTQASPAKTTPTKASVLKALPTVRDHTTDQLNPEGDEYIPREYDEAGEKKVAPNGQPLEGREYRCRTFYVPNRGDKLFMLATECARVLGYRDSYLLFNKNRSLFKIIASQAEKDDLIQQEILPYSYRSRQIAIVTARSMYRQFGSRLIINGRRVRDDYWESKARKQGFTEEDAAGEKRPGAAKQREAAAAEASNMHTLTSLPHGEIIYSNGPAHLEGQPGMGGVNPSTLAPLPMINLAPTDDLRTRDYGNVPRPRQEISGAPYQDRSLPSTTPEVLSHAAQTAEYNKMLGQQRNSRGKYLDEYWKRPHEPAVVPGQRQSAGEGEAGPPTSQTLRSPPVASNVPGGSAAQQGMGSHQQHTPSHVMSTQPYTQPQHPQNPLAQSPMRNMPQPLRPEQSYNRSPGLPMGAGGSTHNQPASYPYPSNQMWHPAQPQPSPLSQTHSIQQYGQHSQHQPQHPSHQSPLHAPTQLHHPQVTGSMHGTPMGYQTVGGMGSANYANVGRNTYQTSPSPQQYMHPTTAPPQPTMQGWAQGPSAHGQQSWQGY